MKVLIYQHDPLLTLVRDEEESIELFGKEHFEEYSIDIPEELAKDLIKTYQHLIMLSKQVKEITK
jgi:hypothetical protein